MHHNSVRRSVLLAAAATGLTFATAVGGASVAGAAPIDKGSFHDVGTDPVYDCDGLRGQDSFDVYGRYLFNWRGSSPYPYYRESVRGTVVTTNLHTGRTYTHVFTVNTADHRITDKGNGIITITDFASGGERFYDANGKLVLRNPGEIRFTFDVDTKGTPAYPDDDVEVPGSFREVRGSTGRNDLVGRDFCADLKTFTG